MSTTPLSREHWEGSAYLERLRSEAASEGEDLLDELLDLDAAERLRLLGSRELLRLRDLLLDERWEPTEPADAAPESEAADETDPGALALARSWDGGPVFAWLGEGHIIDELEWALTDIQAADPEAPPLIAWDLYQAILPRLELLGVADAPLRTPLLSRGERRERDAAIREANARFDAAEAGPKSQLFTPRWTSLIDSLEASPALTVYGFVDGRSNIRNRHDADEVRDRHRETLAALRAESPDPSAPLYASILDREVPGIAPPAGLVGAWPWRVALAIPQGDDPYNGWVWASPALHELDELDELLWACVHEKLSVVFFSSDAAAGWAYSPVGVDGTLLALDTAFLERIRNRLDIAEPVELRDHLSDDLSYEP